MAQFSYTILTNNGRDLIAKAHEGKELKFSKFVIGSGTLPDGAVIPEMTGLIAPRLNMEIARIYNPGHTGTAIISGVVSNKDVHEAFFMREIGLFALDPDTGNELLYAYIYAGDKADYMPAQEGVDVLYFRFDFHVVIEQAQNVTAIFAENPLHVTFADLDGAIDIALKLIREREEFLQDQIDRLPRLVTHKSITEELRKEK